MRSLEAGHNHLEANEGKRKDPRLAAKGHSMTITLAPPAPARGVQIRRAPRAEPPFDDERWDEERGGGERRDDERSDASRSAVSWPMAGDWAELPLDWHPDGSTPTPPAQTPEAPAGPRPSEVAAARFVRACLEILDGFRPVRHLRMLATPESFEKISAELQRPRKRRLLTRLREGTVWSHQPVRGGSPAGRPRPGTGATGAPVPGRVEVRLQRVMDVRDGIAEVVTVLARGEDVWAMAVRLERHPDGWLCTDLQVL
jgi:Family of unknown function (DUF6459)